LASAPTVGRLLGVSSNDPVGNLGPQASPGIGGSFEAIEVRAARERAAPPSHAGGVRLVGLPRVPPWASLVAELPSEVYPPAHSVRIKGLIQNSLRELLPPPETRPRRAGSFPWRSLLLRDSSGYGPWFRRTRIHPPNRLSTSSPARVHSPRAEARVRSLGATRRISFRPRGSSPPRRFAPRAGRESVAPRSRS
jgi:hypothetical protein